VHRTTISDNSAFFEAAVSACWMDGNSKVVKLPETDTQEFEVYVHWVYTHDIDMTFMAEPSQATAPSWLNLSKIWILARYLQDMRLCNQVIDLCLEKLPRVPGFTITHTTLQYAWEHTMTDSPLRRLFTNIMVANVSVRRLDEYGHEYPFEIILSMAREFAGRNQAVPEVPKNEDRCRYHIHEDGVEKCS